MSPTYLEQGLLTDPGKHASALAGLPTEPAAVARVVQGLLIHEFWAGSYGVTMTEEERDRVNLRRIEQVLDVVLSDDDRPLDVQREPARRISSNCRGFSVLAVSILRAGGVPARARCGFGGYFRDGWFEDHWVVEYFDGNSWKLMDTQIDPVQSETLKISFDLTDVARDKFVIAGDAWQRIRTGGADPARYGLSPINEGGDWWIAGNLVRDAAALTGLEVLPWDMWGSMPEPGAKVEVELFDELAAATLAVDGVEELMRDDRLRVPTEVYNHQHGRKEPL
jgi:hypothetical protein